MNATKNLIYTVAPLALLGAFCTVLSALIAGPLSVGLVTSAQLYSAMSFVACFLLIMTFFFLVDSARLARRFADRASGQVDLAALWRALSIMPAMLTGSAVIALLVLSIDGNANLVEIYRTQAPAWQDQILWDLEAPLFHAVTASHWLPLKFWETIYHLMWVYVLLVMAGLVKNGHADSYMALAIAVVLAFYCTTLVAMLFPVAGPAYYQPQAFAYLNGSLSKQLQDFLGAYQAGKIPQNGLYYGTMALPSLHVALTAMATWFVARHWRPNLWFALPWAGLIWASTIVLAWHYALDGVAAVVMAAVCIGCAHALVRLSHMLARRTGSKLEAQQRRA